jgi:hypothetical protein
VPSSRVQFRIENVYIPEPAQLLVEIHGKDILLGEMIDVSESDVQSEAFAVVEVEGLSRSVVVATKYLEEIGRE